MRLLPGLVLVLPLLAGCTPYLPMKADFGTTAWVPTGTVPPEYTKFNAYDPNVNVLVANQICATPYEAAKVTTSSASPGELVTTTGSCARHQPVLGNWR